MKALVTGGTRGIGEAIAKTLIDAGYDVTVTGSRPQGKGPRGSRYLACDFSNPSETEVFSVEIAKSPWSVLINSAGINKIGEIERYDLADFQRIHNVNVIAPFLLSKSLISGMKKRKYGRILNISSIFGVVSKPERGAYSTSKFGLSGLSRALALEVAKHNILVNCLAPGFVDTDLTRGILGAAGMKKIAKQVPMGRLAKPAEIAAVARFLVSKENTYITGQTIVADGGFISA